MGWLFRKGFAVEDDLAFQDQGNGFILLRGAVYCEGALRLDVSKVLRVLEGEGSEALVESVLYSYSLISYNEGTVFRYCSPHAPEDATDPNDHHTFHHLHEFEPPGQNERISKVCEREERTYPTLGEVIERAHQWYCDNAATYSGRGVAPRSRRQ
jgi:hypothetical protein